MNSIVPVDFIDVSRLAATLVLRHSVHFTDDTRRQDAPGSPHHDSASIVLRGPTAAGWKENWHQDVDHSDMPLLGEWAAARHVLEKIGESHYTRSGVYPIFGKVMVVSLRAGGRVEWHIDEGPYAEAHDRFHVCLIPSPGAFLFIASTICQPSVGVLNWVNNRVLHSAINQGPCDRIHLIVDIRKPETRH